MAIVHENKFGWFLDDKLYFDKFYQKVQTQESSEVSFEVHPDIFNILYPFMFDSQFQKYIDNLETSNKLETKEHDSTVPVHSRKRVRKKLLNSSVQVILYILHSITEEKNSDNWKRQKNKSNNVLGSSFYSLYTVSFQKLEEFLYKALKSFRKKLSKPHQLDLSGELVYNYLML